MMLMEEETINNRFTLLLVTILIFMGCENQIVEKPDSVILNDVVGNRIEIYGQSKDEMIDILKKQNLYVDKDMWFYIDREFYQIVEYDALTSGIEDVSDSLTVIWFSKDLNSRDEFIPEYRRSKITIYNKKLFLAITFDEGRNRILKVTYQF